MAVVSDPDSREEENRREWEWAEFQSQQLEKVREAEYRVAKLKYATQPRHKAVARVLVAACKALSLPFAVLAVTIIVLRGKDVPAALEQFIAL